MEQIISRIIDQTYREGELLPSVRQIASDFLVNPLTAARALLLRREKKRFLRDEWPVIRERIRALELDPKELRNDAARCAA